MRETATKISLSQLSSVPYTLLIPLAARARGAEFFPQHHLRDPTAEQVLERLKEKGEEFIGHKATVYAIQSRTQIFVRHAQDFFREHPDSYGASLGCGLSDYFQWIDIGTNHFVDADLPEVMQIRRQLLEPKNARHRFADLSLTSPDWWDKLELPDGKPVQLIIEGVLMYLQPAEVRELLRIFGEKAPAGSELVFDFMCWLGVGKAQRHHPIMKLIKAEFHWGARKIGELTTPHKRLRLLSVERIMKGYKPLQSATEVLFQTLTSVPFYGIARVAT